MADVKDILNISSEKTPSKVETILSGKKRTPSSIPKKKKPEGISREVYALQESALLGAGPAAAAPPPQAPVFKEKRPIVADQKITWNWKGFRNSGRSDGAILKHWVRSDDKSEDYKFARYNRKLKLKMYTNEEYEKYFQDPNWTKEETDQLFELCRTFDLRFVLIADRFESTNPKSVEDLKDRFYTISSKLITLHKVPDEDLTANPLANYVFNKKQEEERKRQSNKLFTRTTAQVVQEEDLVEQFRRIEGEMKKHNKAKKRISQLMQYALTSASSNPPSTPTTPAAGDYATPRQKKRKAHPTDEDDEYEPEFGEEEKEKERKRKDRSVERSRSFVTTPLTVGTKTAYRVDAALVELGLIRSDSPPVPAPSVTKALNDLRQDIVILLDLQKYVPQKEYQLEVLKSYKESLLREIKARDLPVPPLNQPSEKPNLAASSSSLFGLASLDEESSDLLGLGGDPSEITPPPSRVRRDREKEHKRAYKKQKIVEG